LLGIYALLAEWNALMDPAAEPAAVRIKLAWWREEIQRLIARAPVHPIDVYLSALPRAGEIDFGPLAQAIDAVIAEGDGAPLEHSGDLEPHAAALRAAPLMVASRLAAAGLDEDSLQKCARELAVGDFLARSVRDYRREARAGRVLFAVDELLAAGIENEDLCAEQPPPRLERYLQGLRSRADMNYAAVLSAPASGNRAPLRHLSVLAALGRKHLALPSTAVESPRLQDMLLAWMTARRAHG
jgi:phytoene synthase